MKRRTRIIAWQVDGPAVPPPPGTPFFTSGQPVHEPPGQPFDERHARNARVVMWRNIRARLRDGRRLPAPSSAVMAELMREIEQASP